MNVGAIKKWFGEAIADAIQTKEYGTWYWWLDRSGDKHWAICIGFNEPTEERNEFVNNEGYQLCAKLAWQPWNSVLQCDYDVDWMMPVGEDEEVYDTEVVVDERFYEEGYSDGIVDWFLEIYNNVKVQDDEVAD